MTVPPPDKPLRDYYPVRPQFPLPASGIPFRIRSAAPELWEAENPVLSRGEPGYDGTVLKIGDGVVAWNDLSGVVGAGEEPSMFRTVAVGDPIEFEDGDPRFDVVSSVSLVSAEDGIVTFVWIEGLVDGLSYDFGAV